MTYIYTEHKAQGDFFMDKGFLTVVVTGGGVAVPLSGAEVRIFFRQYRADGRYDELEVENNVRNGNYSRRLVTDNEGKTESVAFDTPDIEASFKENNIVAPYSVCDVYVESPGYFAALLFGVQIFPRRDSILPVNLEPYTQSLVDNGTVNSVISGQYTIVYFIPTPEVNGTRINAISAETPANIVNPFVAAEVYVPETITVHLGRPSANAENITLPFQDYIKNVASSEIFPTWPENAIRANVYAQISIALNRVFTEWYVSQGYSFQITNSTAYDQAFVKGRNIYGNIERIVDEIFNTYIRRIGFEEPLFATYCDGRNATCSGMTQWGSFELANKGYSPVSILKYYYGQDIELVSTDNIMGIESTYSGLPLAIGSSGDDVSVIQRQLNRIREDYPAIPLIAFTNGVFGTDTDAAVRKFQSVFNLTADGVVGKATWYRISIVYVSVKRLAELSSEGQSADFKRVDISVLLGFGDRGDDVETLQYLIEYISIFYRNVRPTGVDGIFGQSTLDSLLSFQRAFGLSETGTTTEETWYTIYAVYDSIVKAVLPISEEQYFPGVLEQGDSGESVRLIQRYLNEIAAFYGDLPTLSEDGIFGTQTRNAIYEFQRLYLVNETGIVDSGTWYRIVELYNYIQSQKTN